MDRICVVPEGAGAVITLELVLFERDLQNAMEEGGGIEHRTPMHGFDEFQFILCDQPIGPFQTCSNTLRRFIGELDGGLKNLNGKLGMRFCC